MCGAGVGYGRPQYSAGGGGGPLSVSCQSQAVSAGVYKFSCVGVDQSLITLSSEHILWLKGAGGENQQLDVVIPNYRVEELIRAAVKGSQGGSTNVNILLQKPQTVYDVQAQDAVGGEPAQPSVNLQYEPVDKPTSLHYPTDKQYNPLSGPIREPGSSPVTSAGPY